MANTRQPISFIATTDPDTAKAFYSDTMDLALIEASQFALAFADGDRMLRVQIVPALTPAAFTVHGWQVANIADEIQTLGAKGVTFLSFDHVEQDAHGIWTTPEGDKIAWFKDPTGNMLSLTQFANPDA